jgi:hypothetical protein
MARGIDSIAHWGALRTGRTVAVLGSGLEDIYPKEKRPMRDLLRKRGHLIRLRTSMLISLENIITRNCGRRVSVNDRPQQKRLLEVSYRGTTYKPASINREIEVMRRIFNLAMREDMVVKNPCWKVTSFQRRTPETVCSRRKSGKGSATFFPSTPLM